MVSPHLSLFFSSLGSSHSLVTFTKHSKITLHINLGLNMCLKMFISITAYLHKIGWSVGLKYFNSKWYLSPEILDSSVMLSVTKTVFSPWDVGEGTSHILPEHTLCGRVPRFFAAAPIKRWSPFLYVLKLRLVFQLALAKRMQWKPSYVGMNSTFRKLFTFSADSLGPL